MRRSTGERFLRNFEQVGNGGYDTLITSFNFRDRRSSGTFCESCKCGRQDFSI